MAKPALGRGLGGLLGGNTPKAAAPASAPITPTAAAPAGDSVRTVGIAQLVPCPFQPRKDFSDDALRELADSIKAQGIIQPLIVREKGGRFEIIAGERRWRAAQLAELKNLPVIVREANDRAVLEMALIENLQRENLNPIEEALGYSQLIEAFHLKQEDAATKVGKSRTVVANALRLLKLPSELQTVIRNGQLSVGHAKAILGLDTAEQQRQAAQRVLKSGLTVRQTEALVAEWAKERPGGNDKKSANRLRDVHVVDLENKLREHFGTKVQLRYASGKGVVEISFYNDDDLSRILKLTGIAPD